MKLCESFLPSEERNDSGVNEMKVDAHLSWHPTMAKEIRRA